MANRTAISQYNLQFKNTIAEQRENFQDKPKLPGQHRKSQDFYLFKFNTLQSNSPNYRAKQPLSVHINGNKIIETNMNYIGHLFTIWLVQKGLIKINNPPFNIQ